MSTRAIGVFPINGHTASLRFVKGALMTKRTFTAVGAAIVIALAAFSSTTSAHAQGLRGGSWVATANGIVGVEQTILLKAPKLRGKVATFSLANAATATNAAQAAVNSQGFAYLPWTPNLPGVWTITATSGNKTIDQTSIAVAATPTTTTLLSTDEVQRQTPTTIIAEVRALAGLITPSGTITVRTSTGALAATGSLNPTSTPGLASVTMNWTPPPQSVGLTATYTPDSTAFHSSTSTTITPGIVTQQKAVSLRTPPVMYVGVPATISAVIGTNSLSALGGSTAFNLSIDGFTFYVMGGSQPINAGVSTITWTPSQPGIQTINVEYASADLAINGQDSQAVNIQPAPTADTITVTPTGSPAWNPGNVGTLTQNSWVEVTPQSTSGHPVTLTSDGPCAIEAGTITVLGPGTCSITATSLGNGADLAPTQAAYTITVTKPPKKR